MKKLSFKKSLLLLASGMLVLTACGGTKKNGQSGRNSGQASTDVV